MTNTLLPASGQPKLDDDGLCKRCATIDWDEMAHAVEHFPIRRLTPGQRLHVFHIDTTIQDTSDELLRSSCRFCRLLGEATITHHHLSPGELHCCHDGSSMVSIQMETLVSALAITLDDIAEAKHKFLKEYATIKSIDFEAIKEQIDACEHHHEECTPDLLGDLPGFRVIDCETKTIVPASSTIFTDDRRSTTANRNYVALSYVWGPKPDESYKGASGELKNLPQTIDDAVCVTLALGYRYLWVDRYCIDQKNLKEKAIQIANMGKIYSSAQLTIVASVGEDPEYGLPGLTNHGSEVPFRYETIKRLRVIVRPMDSIESISVSKWATRGWTYQEGYLSRKRLFFTDKSVHYICNASTSGSSLHRFLPRSKETKPRSRPYTEVSIWTFRLAPVTRNLEAYSARQLSVDSDALHAITGALNAQMMNQLPVHHLWGVPIFETDIDFDLGPSGDFSKGRNPPEVAMSIEFLLSWYHYRPCRRRPEFPSWSFLGWAGRIYYSPWPRQTHIGEHFTVHNLQKPKQPAEPAVIPLDSNARPRFALTPSGTRYLDITTYTLPLALINVTWTNDTPKNGYHVVADLHNGTEAYAPVKWSREPSDVYQSGSALMGALFITERKIQKPQSSTVVFVLEKHDDCYERIGLCVFAGAKLKIVKASPREALGSVVNVQDWEYADVTMSEWQEMATKQRILIG